MDKSPMIQFHRLFISAFAALTFIAFGGDLVADSICDTMGHAEMSDASHSGSDDSCQHCICATHVGILALPAAVTLPTPNSLTETGVIIGDEQALEGLPVAIDHPPQLS